MRQDAQNLRRRARQWATHATSAGTCLAGPCTPDERADRDSTPLTGSTRQCVLRHRALLVLLAPILIAARCSEPEPVEPPLATTGPMTPPQPVTTAPATQPGTEPTSPGSLETSDAPTYVDPRDVELPRTGWLRVERLAEDVEGGWVTGHSPTSNRIVIETHNVVQFSMDISRLELDWSRPVWVRLDASAFELTHKRNPVVHLRKTSVGAWNVVKPDEG